MTPTVCAILCAAGKGNRAGFEKNKLLVDLNGSPVLRQTLQAFDRECIDEIIIAYSPCDKTEIEKLAKDIPRVTLVEGGDTRTQTVYNALQAVKSEIVLIHDGARPFVSENIILNSLKASIDFGASVPGISPTDTQKQISKDGFIEKHLERNLLVSVQTPQCFEFSKLFHAHKKAISDNKEYTDDTEIWGKYCGPVKVVPGDANNIKITYPSDLEKLKI
jgi:2-C-methyl-D-erythritol 4-phosphate cytidylyltransferase